MDNQVKYLEWYSGLDYSKQQTVNGFIKSALIGKRHIYDYSGFIVLEMFAKGILKREGNWVEITEDGQLLASYIGL